jgi:superfamily II DNA or RNA helicase
LARPEIPGPLPGWLLEHQRPLVRRLLPMLTRHGAALLAAPAGSGKTYLALAAAALWSRSPAIALVPAVLMSQWRRTAAKLGIEITIWSHERVSRGRLPELLLEKSKDRALVIIDESHHFRNPGSLRYRHLAPALVGHRVLLLSATPAVNRLSDIAHQLLLGVRDDVLGPFGIPSLREHLVNAKEAHPAIATLILTSPDTSIGKPRRRDHRARAEPGGPLASACAVIDSLVLSRTPPVAGLIRIVLYRALASSPAALAGALRRYRGLLLHAGEALASGRTLDRAELRRFIGSAPDQLMMWELLPCVSTSSDLDLGDLGPIEALLERMREWAKSPDEKCRKLGDQLGNGLRTIVFTSARETVRYLRDHLGPSPIAWCTGAAAGIGTTRMPRDLVLGWFGPGSPNGGPRVLITTDVAAEGLDLQGVEQVVHYDLPWTSVRLDQRDGRALRLGSLHEKVDVIRFDPPALLADRLRQVTILARKRALPRRAGLVGATARTWQWRDRLAQAAEEWGRIGRWAAVNAESGGVLAGFTIVIAEPNGASRDLATMIGWLDRDGHWSEQPDAVDRALRTIGQSAPVTEPPQALLDGALELLSPIVRARLDATRASRWARPVRGSAAARLIERLNRLSADAARARDSSRLLLLERALRFAARGHTAGEEYLIQVLLGLPDSLAYQRLQHGPPAEADPLPRVRLNGLIVFAPVQSGIMAPAVSPMGVHLSSDC